MFSVLRVLGTWFYRTLSVFEKSATLIVGLLILSSLGGATIIVGVVKALPPVAFLGGGVTILGLAVGISVYRIISKPSPITESFNVAPPLRFIREDVEIQLKHVVYEYLDQRHMQHRKRFVLRSLRNGVESFADRYLWTGRGKIEVRSRTPGFSIINERRQEFWNVFDVAFPSPLREGDEVDFTVEWDLWDDYGTAVPFLSTLIDSPTKHLVLTVVLPLNLKPSRAFCHDFENYIDTLPVKTFEVPWDPATQSLTYDVADPQSRHKYIIRWVYDKSK